MMGSLRFELGLEVEHKSCEDFKYFNRYINLVDFNDFIGDNNELETTKKYSQVRIAVILELFTCGILKV